MTSQKVVDILLINPGGSENTYQQLGEDLAAVEPPVWAAMIGGYVRHRGYSVRIIDAQAEGWGANTVAAKVAELNPTIAVVVVFGHQPSASTQQMAPAGELCSAIKDVAPKVPLLILGGHVSALPERTCREEAVDFVCQGEGPETICRLVDTLKSETPFSLNDVPGLGYLKEDQFTLNRPAPLMSDIDADIPISAWDLLPMERYRAHNWQCFGDLGKRTPYAAIYTTLGCPYKCSFCCIHAPFGKNNYRMRQPDSVVAEMAHLYDTYGVETFKFSDEMFVLNDRHLKGICEGLIEGGYNFNIWAYARVDTVKPEMLGMLRQAGFRWLALGIESGSKHVRDGAQKTLRHEDIVGIVDAIQKADINVIGNYIFGLPDDDLESMRETLDLAKQVKCEFSNFYSAMAYPGSPLYTMAESNGLDLPDSWSGYSQHSYDCKPLATEKVSAADVLRFRDSAFDEYFSDHGYLDYITQKFGVETRRHIQSMAQHKLRRKLLEEVTT